MGRRAPGGGGAQADSGSVGKASMRLSRMGGCGAEQVALAEEARKQMTLAVAAAQSTLKQV